MNMNNNSAYPTLRNGNFQGFDLNGERPSLLFLGVPWDVTTSYSPGTADGPKAIIEASYQLEHYSALLPNCAAFPIETLVLQSETMRRNSSLRKLAEEIIRSLESGSTIEEEIVSQKLKKINTSTEDIRKDIYNTTTTLLKDGRLIGLVGGDHSIPLGFIQALDQNSDEPFGILQIDAHADLRQAYEGFIHSHASIMFNVLESTQVQKLVQVGIRDLCEEEAERTQQDSRISTFYEAEIRQMLYAGTTWKDIVAQILSRLPQRVYISFDIDGLDPSLAPNTGTPVPGGLSYGEVYFLIEKLVESGREIIGFDLVEVAPSQSNPDLFGADWNAVVGARVFRLLADAALSRKAKG